MDKPAFDELTQDIRTHPDMPTNREAQALDAEAAAMMAEVSPEDQKAAVRASIENDLTTQLVAAGADRSAAMTQVQPLVAMAQQLADRSAGQIGLQALWDRYNIKVVNGEIVVPPAAATLLQAVPAPTFYSATLQSTDTLPQAKGSPEQMLAMLKKAPGVKQAELDTLGLPDWLAKQGKSVTREQIADFVRANQLQVTETVLAPAMNCSVK